MMAENPPSKLSEPKDIQVQTQHKLLKTKGILKVAGEKWKVTWMGTFQVTVNFVIQETMEARRMWLAHLKCPKQVSAQNSIPSEMPLRLEGE